jgi:hypothetical protein
MPRASTPITDPHDPYFNLEEALDQLRSVDPTLVDQAALDKLNELCRLDGVRAIGLRCEPSSRPYLRMGRPIEGFEPIPARDWADLHFGFDEGDQVAPMTCIRSRSSGGCGPGSNSRKVI